MKEQTEFLNQQLKNNKESEYEIKQLNDQVTQIRTRLNHCNEDVQLKTNELITMKRQLRNEANRLQQIRQKNRQVNIDCDKMTRSIAKLNEVVQDLVSKVDEIQSEKNNADNRLRHLEELFDNEEKSIFAIESEMLRLSQMLYRSSQILQQQHDENKLVEVRQFNVNYFLTACCIQFLL